jgi:hypothetical protein
MQPISRPAAGSPGVVVRARELDAEIRVAWRRSRESSARAAKLLLRMNDEGLHRHLGSPMTVGEDA